MASPKQSYLLDGTGDYITLVDNAGFDVDTYVSIGMWVCRDYDDLRTISELLHRASSYDVKIESENQVRFTISGAGVIDSKSTIPAEKPVFIVCTAAESGTSLVMKIYVNGLLDTSVTVPSATMPAANANALSIGGGAAGVTPLKGTISSIFLTSDAITAAEVKAIYDSASGQATSYLDNLVIDIDTEGDLVNAGSAGNGTAQGDAAARTYMHLFQSMGTSHVIHVPELETGYLTRKTIKPEKVHWTGEAIADGDGITLQDYNGDVVHSYTSILDDQGGTWYFSHGVEWRGLKIYELDHGKLEITVR